MYSRIRAHIVATWNGSDWMLSRPFWFPTTFANMLRMMKGKFPSVNTTTLANTILVKFLDAFNSSVKPRNNFLRIISFRRMGLLEVTIDRTPSTTNGLIAAK